MAPDESTPARVGADMQRIFGGVAMQPAPGRLPPARGDAPVRRTPRRRRNWLALAGIVAAVAAIAWWPAPVESPRPLPPPPPVDRAAATPDAAAATAITAPRVVISLPTPVPASTPTPRRTAAAAAAVRTRPSPTPGPTPLAEASRERTPGARDGAICAAARDRAGCLYLEVRSADERMRDAYDRAGADGVPNEELRRIRRAWVDALDGSAADPIATIHRLDRLSTRLYNEMAR